jgi:hypothetical protein
MFKIKLKTRTRDGISIIEVLTSMAVATIGVFGVMVMIPFAVKQSQTGLDNDAANSLGRNAVEEIQLRGFLEVDDNDDLYRLVINARADGDTTGLRFDQLCSTSNFANERAPGLFHFDPVGFAEGLTSFTIADIEIFSTTASRLAPVPIASLPSPGPFSVREASRLCRSRDEVFYKAEGDADEATAPPQPLFDLSGTAEVKRQFSGRISWSAFLVPEKDPFLASAPTKRYRTNVLTYRDRFIGPSAAATPPGLRVSDRDANPNPGSCYDYYQVNNAPGYQASVSQVNLVGTIDSDELGRDDWIMLVNRIPNAAGAIPPVVGGVRAADAGYRTQVMFAKVTRVGTNTVTIDGGAFDFVAPANAGSSETYMVHLKNVINVFERSIAIEQQ